MKLYVTSFIWRAIDSEKLIIKTFILTFLCQLQYKNPKSFKKLYKLSTKLSFPPKFLFWKPKKNSKLWCLWKKTNYKFNQHNMHDWEVSQRNRPNSKDLHSIPYFSDCHAKYVWQLKLKFFFVFFFRLRILQKRDKISVAFSWRSAL